MMIRKLLLGLACAAISNLAIAQKITPDPPANPGPPSKLYAKDFIDTAYRPKITADSVAGFAARPIKPGDIVFLGNSISARCNWALLFNNNRLRNRGIPGDLTFGVLERLEEVIAGKPSKVFILIGINDISRNVPDSLIIRNHKLMISRIQKASPKTKIYFCTLLPVNATFGRTLNHYKEERVLAINEAIKKYSGKNLKVIDLYPWFLDEQGKLKAEYTFDGLHPNLAGYMHWKELFLKNKYLSD